MIEIKEDYIDYFLNNDNTILIINSSRDGDILYPCYERRLDSLCKSDKIIDNPLYKVVIISNNKHIFILKTGLYNQFLKDICLYQAIQDYKKYIIANKIKLVMECYDILMLHYWLDIEAAFNNEIEFVVES